MSIAEAIVLGVAMLCAVFLVALFGYLIFMRSILKKLKEEE